MRLIEFVLPVGHVTWPIHGNLDVTLMVVFCNSFVEVLAKLRQNQGDENPKLFKTIPGGREAAPRGYFAKFGFSSTWFCQSFVQDLPKRQALK